MKGCNLFIFFEFVMNDDGRGIGMFHSPLIEGTKNRNGVLVLDSNGFHQHLVSILPFTSFFEISSPLFCEIERLGGFDMRVCTSSSHCYTNVLSGGRWGLLEDWLVSGMKNLRFSRKELVDCHDALCTIKRKYASKSLVGGFVATYHEACIDRLPKKEHQLE